VSHARGCDREAALKFFGGRIRNEYINYLGQPGFLYGLETIKGGHERLIGDANIDVTFSPPVSADHNELPVQVGLSNIILSILSKYGEYSA
jgi:hypothetical protein